MKLVEVAVAVMVQDGHVLIAQRPMHATHGGMWEFPGGKIETNEKPEAAVARELREEIGIEAQSLGYIMQIRHNYDDWDVCLWVFKVETFKGVPKAMEQQLELKWIPFNELEQYAFPAANQEILQYVKTYYTR